MTSQKITKETRPASGLRGGDRQKRVKRNLELSHQKDIIFLGKLFSSIASLGANETKQQAFLRPTSSLEAGAKVWSTEGRQREPRLSSYSSLPKEHESECNAHRALVLLLTKISVKLPLAKFFIIHVMRLLSHSDNKQNAIISFPKRQTLAIAQSVNCG